MVKRWRVECERGDKVERKSWARWGKLSERVGAKVREKGDNSSVNGARERMRR